MDEFSGEMIRGAREARIRLVSTGKPEPDHVSYARFMHVAFLISQLGVGGAERQFIGLAAGLAERGHRVRFVTLFGGGAFAGRLLAETGIESEPVLARRPRLATLWLPRTVGRLRNLLSHDAPDVLYAGDYPANLVAAAVAPNLGIRLVWGLRCEGRGLSAPLRLARRMGRRSRGGVDLCISNSVAALEFHRDLRYLPARSIVIPNGVDVDSFRPDVAASSLRVQLGIPEDAVVVGMVARFDPLKDHGLFLRAAARVADVEPRVVFLVAAPSIDAIPPEVARLASSPPLHGRVFFHAAGSDPLPVYRALDLFASTSRSEGFPNVVVEAMACGVPCVVTDVGDCAVAVGDAGVVVPAGDLSALTTALSEAIGAGRDELRRRGARARERVVEHFARPLLVTRSEEALRSVVGAA